jgi:hypothetical protein
MRSLTYSQWDADRIFGCVCDEGFSGYSCQQRSCAKGADPLVVAQNSLVPQVQQIVCTCSGACDGYVIASLLGVTTDPIAHNAVALRSAESTSTTATGIGYQESLQAKLEMLTTKEIIQGITMSSGSLCSAAGSTTQITFSNGKGNVPEIYIDFSTTLTSDGQSASQGGSVAVVVSTVQVATATPELCSHRGVCQSVAGSCLCSGGFTQSDGNGNAGTIGDCGHRDLAVNLTSCATNDLTLVCSGHGSCSGSPLYRCTCVAGYLGGDCSMRECPKGRAWFDEAFEDNKAHQLAECSNMGSCDTGSGVCSCRPGFTGSACDRMDCPRSTEGLECSGKGRCLSLRKLAPLGLTQSRFPNNGKNEIQQLRCTLSAGSFRLTFRHAMTGPIAFSATAAELRDALESLFPVTLVTVVLSPDNGAICSASGETALIEFTHDYGDLPLITADSASVAITEMQAGSRVSYGDSLANAATWDADQIHACHCDGYPDYNQSFAQGDRGRYWGPACELRTCATGTDPMGAVPIRYSIACTADGGTIKLSFSGYESEAIGAAADGQGLEAALGRVSSISRVFATDVPAGGICGIPAVTSQVWLETTVEEASVVDLAVASTASLAASSGVVAATVSRVSAVRGNENQTLTCAATGGTFTLTFHAATTKPIAFNANEQAFQAALQDLATIGRATIAMGGTVPKTVCSPSGVATVITFSTQLGDVELLSAETGSLIHASGTPSVTVAETDKGTTTVQVCSGRGYCGKSRTRSCFSLAPQLLFQSYLTNAAFQTVTAVVCLRRRRLWRLQMLQRLHQRRWTRVQRCQRGLWVFRATVRERIALRRPATEAFITQTCEICGFACP